MVSGGRSPTILNHVTRWNWKVRFNSQPLHPLGKGPYINWTAGWLGSRAGLRVWRRKCLLRVRITVALQGICAHSGYSVDLFWNKYINFHSELLALMWENGIIFYAKSYIYVTCCEFYYLHSHHMIRSFDSGLRNFLSPFRKIPEHLLYHLTPVSFNISLIQQ
jgi:hypothetical protein